MDLYSSVESTGKASSTREDPGRLDDADASVSAHVRKAQAADAEQTVWGPDMYVRLPFNNLGSWRAGLFKLTRRYDDSVTYKFLMPIFVIGKWEVTSPSIPPWGPPKAEAWEFKLSDLLPTLGVGKVGRLLSGSIGFVAAGLLLLVFVPGLAPILSGVLGLVGRLFRRRG